MSSRYTYNDLLIVIHERLNQLAAAGESAYPTDYSAGVDEGKMIAYLFTESMLKGHEDSIIAETLARLGGASEVQHAEKA